jgi:hypothetical protein
LFIHIKTYIFDVLILFLFVTKVHFVHPYWIFQFPNIHLLQKFNLFTHIEASNFQMFICYKTLICSPISKTSFLKYWSNFYFVKKVQFVHPYWSFQFSNISSDLFICYKSSICSSISKHTFLKYWSFFYFVRKVQFFLLAIFKNSSDLFICYKSSICSPISKLAFWKYWSFFYFVTKFQFVHPHWIFQFSNIHMLQTFNLFTHIKTCIFEILIKFLFC